MIIVTLCSVLFSVHTKTKSGRFQIAPGVFEKLRFRDGLVWTVLLANLSVKLNYTIDK